MRYLFSLSLVLLCNKVYCQDHNLLNTHELIMKKLEKENKELKDLSKKELWNKFNKPNPKDFYSLLNPKNNAITLGRMPAIIIQPPTIGIMPAIIEKPVTLGRIPDIAITKKSTQRR